ncbi:MAG: sigma-70 family RNA polymerase sigma factor [Geminicoccaceae bacterium]
MNLDCGMDRTVPIAKNRDDHVAQMEAIVKRRSREAFAALFDHFAPKLKGYYRKGGIDAMQAEDLAQETMLSVWRHAAKFSPKVGSPSTWIFTIARNHLIDHVRRRKSREGELTDPTLLPTPIETADDLVDAQQRYRFLKAALLKLPKEQAAILKMAFFDHKAHSEIAAETGVPLGTVKSRIRLAMQRLRDDLGEQGIDPGEEQ